MKTLALLTLFFTLLFSAAAQQETSFTGCASDELMQRDPQLLQAQNALDLQKYTAFLAKGKPGKGGGLKSLEVIPVVVHIVHNGGPENISDAQVQTAISNINAKFAASPYNQIQFCLAQRDPNGNATTGITRNASPLTTEYMEIDDIALKNVNRWPPTCYLNIWVIQEILSISSGSGVVGYAFLPAAHGLNMDGIVIEAGYFGSSTDSDAVGTHEIGHYLGLYHTFQGGCGNANCLLDGDQVCDTPPDQTTFATCNPAANSCNTDAADPSANNPFTTDVADLSDDYMDYSDFSCYTQFTEDQYDRMHYFLTGIRNSLLNCLSCSPPCTTPFTAQITTPPGTMNVTTGTSVSFSGTATAGTTYSWYIVPGTVLSTGMSTSFTFTTAGSYWMKFRSESTDPAFCLDGLDSVLIIVSEPAVTSCHGSLLFDAVNNISVDLPMTNEYYSGTNGGYTWETWFKLNDPFDSQTARPLISAIDQVVFEDQYLGFGWNGGWFDEPVTRLVFKVDGPFSTTPSGPNCSYAPPGGFTIGTWYHAAGVMDYTTQTSKLYVNGQLVDTKTVTTPPITRVIPTELSYYWSNINQSLRGNMDEVRIWDRVRTASEIATYYNQCVDESDPNLSVYYHCNQSAGTTVIDAGPESNDGTFSVSSGWSPDEPAFVGTSCIVSCIEICGNGIDDNNDGEIDEDCLCAPVFAGNDTITCPGSSVQLQATSGFSGYHWTPATGLSDPNVQNPVASPTVPTTYVVTATSTGPNLVVNGNFSAGNFGFTSGQTYTPSYSPCNYYVAPTFFTGYPELTDHTPSADNMYMSIDGCTSQTMLWQETISGLDQNTTYNFGFWASRANQVQPDFLIQLTGNVTGLMTLPVQPGIPYTGIWTWDEYGIPNWNSGANTSVIVRVINTELDGYGNDFAVDDFHFERVCSTTDTVTVAIAAHAVETLNLGSDIEICTSAVYTFDAGTGFLTYQWNDGSTAQTLTAYEPGTYWVTVTDSCNGIQQDTVNITLKASPGLEIGADMVMCAGGSAALSATPAATFNSFQWTPSTGLSCAQCPDPVVIPLVTTTYFLVATTSDGCTAVDSVHILIGNPAALELGADITVCIGGSATLAATPVNAFDTFVWTPAGSLSCADCPSTIAGPAVSTTYYLTASVNGCTDTDSIRVLVEENAPTGAEVTVKDLSCESKGLVIFTSVTGGSDLIYFNFNNQGFSMNDTYTGLEPGTYPVSIQNGTNQCSYDTIIEIAGEYNVFYAPNTLTPDGDEFNQLWKIYGYCIGDIECTIYNRWGEVVAVLSDPDDGWDGTYNDRMVPDGAYVYTLYLTYASGEVQFVTGTIYVLR